uniref:Uncharacterized protein n=1 Tax=Heterorhabditis bacteriophora TaxID=37862 RepID=A0A1I7XAP4_HETBA
MNSKRSLERLTAVVENEQRVVETRKVGYDSTPRTPIGDIIFASLPSDFQSSSLADAAFCLKGIVSDEEWESRATVRKMDETGEALIPIVRLLRNKREMKQRKNEREIPLRFIRGAHLLP